MVNIFNTILIKPIFNALIWLYDIIPGDNIGLAVIGLTLIIRLLLMPLSLKATRSQIEMSSLQPKIKSLQEKYKNDRNQLAQETMKLYKEHNVNPFGGCLPILIQLPILIALYRVFFKIFQSDSLALLYSFVGNPGEINPVAFGIFDLAQRSIVLGIIAAGLQFYQSKWLMDYQKKKAGGDDNNPMLKMSQQMTYIFPVMIIFISLSVPAALTLYWVVNTLFSIFEQRYARRNISNAAVITP